MTLYSSREPFNVDPKPYVTYADDRRTDVRSKDWDIQSDGAVEYARAYEPRPEYDRPQNNPTNPILTEFRRSAPWDIAKAAAIEVRWLSGMRTAPVPATATYAQVNHARKVLTRLAALKEES